MTADPETIRAQCLMLAAYNREANNRLYETCASMPEDELYRDAGAFFGSIHQTLNHILVADQIWLARFEDIPCPHAALNDVPHAAFADLRAARHAYDDHIESFFKTASGAMLSEEFHFKNMAGVAMSKPFPLLALHLFNHQTHHRGQVLTLIAQAGVETPVLDMPYCV